MGQYMMLQKMMKPGEGGDEDSTLPFGFGLGGLGLGGIGGLGLGGFSPYGMPPSAYGAPPSSSYGAPPAYGPAPASNPLVQYMQYMMLQKLMNPDEDGGDDDSTFPL